MEETNIKIHTIEEITAPFDSSSKGLSQYMRGRLTSARISTMDVMHIVLVLQKLMDTEFSPEVTFCDDKYCESEDLKKRYVQIAQNGQGDSWLLELENGLISFFDHNNSAVVPIFIDFWQFVQLADLLSQYEVMIDEADDNEVDDKEPIYKQMEMLMRAIHKDLPENYPFYLFE